MRSASIFAALACTVLVATAGCERQDEQIAGLSIPVPSEMKKVPDKVFSPIPGFKDGQATFTGKMTPDDIFTFYQRAMAAQGWKPTTFMREGKNQVTYTKDNRACLVWYTMGPDGNAILTIMVGTLEPPK
jgi:hypothetical protein